MIMEDAAFLRGYIRDVPDFPKAGILFRDITPLLAAPPAFARAVAALTSLAPDETTHIAAVEARGFIFAAAVAAQLKKPFVPVRKSGKLPYHTITADYALEYGDDSLAIHTDAVGADSAVFLVDDLIATGGTLAAAARLIAQCGATVAQIACLIELADLGGAARLPQNTPFASIIQY